jgi:hypothetical protein
MATICSFQRVISKETVVSPHLSTDREMELVAIIAAAELAFDQMFRARQDIAA